MATRTGRQARREGAPRILAIDAGGTIRTRSSSRTGAFTIDTAQSTPDDEGVDVVASFENAMQYWGVDPHAAGLELRAEVYSGTANAEPAAGAVE